MIVDIYTHIFPERFFQELERGSPKLGNLGKVANDSMAELVAQHPKRFPAFAAAVNLNDVDFSIREAERAIKMGARGVQTFTNITGHPLAALSAVLRGDGSARPAGLAAPGAHLGDGGLCLRAALAFRDVVVLRLAL